MATVARFTVDSTEFPLGSVFERVPGVTVELERVVPTVGSVVPYFWVRGAGVDDIAAEFSDHPGVRNIQLIDVIDHEYLLRCEWSAEYEGVLSGLVETGVALLSAIGTADRWTFEIRGDDHDSIAEFQRYCLDRGVPVTVTALHSLESLREQSEFGLTDAQREALLLAYERGYFEEPRQTSLAELAAELDISRQALASRLRRGHERLIRSALTNS
jgi:hypothetical protein